ncbi:hypothetical protein [Chromobacterium sphagni]|nr:hypothetical protein [Chromobacterium sphagni]
MKRNVLVSTFQPHPLLSRAAFASLVMDFLVSATAIWKSGATAWAGCWS